MTLADDLQLEETEQIQFEFEDNELIEKILEACNAYKIQNNVMNKQALAIDTGTLTRYIAYNSFNHFIGATRHPKWNILYSNIEKKLRKVAEKRGLNWIILSKTEDKLGKMIGLEKKENKKNSLSNNPTIRRDVEHHPFEVKPVNIDIKQKLDNIVQKTKRTGIAEEKSIDVKALDVDKVDDIDKKDILEENLIESFQIEESQDILNETFINESDVKKEIRVEILPNESKVTTNLEEKQEREEIAQNLERETVKETSQEHFSIVHLDYERYMVPVSAVQCKICSYIGVDKQALVQHLEEHTIKDFRDFREKS